MDKLTETCHLVALDSTTATFRRLDLPAMHHLAVHIDAERFRDLGRPGALLVTVEPTTPAVTS